MQRKHSTRNLSRNDALRGRAERVAAAYQAGGSFFLMVIVRSSTLR
jgi:hypothetical protein